MQTILFNTDTQTIEYLWFSAAKRECIQYEEHGILTETAEDGHEVCFNCGGSL